MIHIDEKFYFFIFSVGFNPIESQHNVAKAILNMVVVAAIVRLGIYGFMQAKLNALLCSLNLALTWGFRRSVVEFDCKFVLALVLNAEL